MFITRQLELYCMKRCFLVALTLLTLIACQRSEDWPFDSARTDNVNIFSKEPVIIISKEEALKRVEPLASRYPDRWIDISDGIIPAGTTIAYNLMGHHVDVDDCAYVQSPDYDAWLLVIEKDPDILGAQSLVHIFVDVESGSYTTMELEGRAIIEWDTSRNIYVPSKTDQTIKSMTSQRQPERNGGSTTKWAVIISGGCDMTNNYSRYYNDCVNIYIKLTQELDFPKGNIYCLIADGTDPAIDQRTGTNTYINSNPDLDGDGTNDIQYKATKNNLSTVFNNLSLLVSPGDEVLVFMTDHGGTDGCFYLWDYETLYPSALNTELNKLGSSVFIDIVMGQCHSGAFIIPLSASNRTIATSCLSTEVAYTSAFQYNYFLHYWTEAISYYAMTGDSYVAPAELFGSAYSSVVSFLSQHPQFASSPSDFGSSHSIAGEIIPYIFGSDYLSTATNSLYSIVNIPNPCSVTWSFGHSISSVSHTDSTAVVKGNVTTPGRYFELSTRITATLVVNGKTHAISKNIVSVWRPGVYMNDGNIWGDNGTYTVRYAGGEYDYQWYSTNPAWMITGYIASTASVLEGLTDNPVSLVVSFYDPLGEQITVSDQVYPVS